MEVHEVYECRVTQYDLQRGTGSLFVQYIDMFLKQKAEASGYPSWVQSLADEDRYIGEFATSEGIQLDKFAIRANPDKRGLAKICLNSMLAGLTERNDRTRTKMISDPQEQYRFLATPGIEVATLMFANDDVVWASWQYITEENFPNLRHTNEVIRAYVTAGARIHLYAYLDSLQERALY